MTTVRIGAKLAKNRQDVLDWLEQNVGAFISKDSVMTGYFFRGEGWMATWHQYGAGWFMDVAFDDPKHATFFTLYWK